MGTLKAIVKKKQSVVRFERSLALEKIKQRKAETRRKIEWGGLVVKSAMSDYPKDIILGALLHARKEIEAQPGTKDLYQSIGKAAFMNYGEK